jgi:hypothetical protein
MNDTRFADCRRRRAICGRARVRLNHFARAVVLDQGILLRVGLTKERPSLPPEDTARGLLDTGGASGFVKSRRVGAVHSAIFVEVMCEIVRWFLFHADSRQRP